MLGDLLETLETISLHSVNQFLKSLVKLIKMTNNLQIVKQINISDRQTVTKIILRGHTAPKKTNYF